MTSPPIENTCGMKVQIATTSKKGEEEKEAEGGGGGGGGSGRRMDVQQPFREET